MNYAPTPGEAYNSLRYIVTELTGGQLIRGLHHWGASLMIIVVVLHMMQVFLWGAYKKPREGDVDGRVRAVAADAGVRADRILAAVGQPGLLGHHRDMQIASQAPGAGLMCCGCWAAKAARSAW